MSVSHVSSSEHCTEELYFIFLRVFRPALEVTHLTIKRVPGVGLQGLKRPYHETTTNFYLVPKLSMNSAIPPLVHMLS